MVSSCKILVKYHDQDIGTDIVKIQNISITSHKAPLCCLFLATLISSYSHPSLIL